MDIIPRLTRDKTITTVVLALQGKVVRGCSFTCWPMTSHHYHLMYSECFSINTLSRECIIAKHKRKLQHLLLYVQKKTQQPLTTLSTLYLLPVLRTLIIAVVCTFVKGVVLTVNDESLNRFIDQKRISIYILHRNLDLRLCGRRISNH
jgi:hypothetical protein